MQAQAIQKSIFFQSAYAWLSLLDTFGTFEELGKDEFLKAQDQISLA